MKNLKTIAIVDAYSTASKITKIIKDYGHRVLHIQSSENIPAIYRASFQKNDFFENLVNFGDLERLVELLTNFNVSDIIAGAESGTILADYLSEKLSLPGNPSSTSLLRRDKYLMGEAVRENGLNAVIQEKISSVNEAVLVAEKWKIWPLVVKPLNSAGSDGVSICSTVDEVKKSVMGLLNKKNRLDIDNATVLIQERMFGQQYIVNSISDSGKHYITEIWKDNRQEVSGAGLIYDNELLIDHTADEWTVLCDYVLRVLDALNVKYGPCHTEIMLTKEGPKLIELGARLQGGISSEAVTEAIGESHLTLTASLLCDKNRLENFAARNYVLKKKIMSVALISHVDGIIKKSHLVDKISELRSFKLFLSKPSEGDQLSKTVDLFTSPGVVYLLSDEKETLLSDYRKIRDWEKKEKLYDLF